MHFYFHLPVMLILSRVIRMNSLEVSYLTFSFSHIHTIKVKKVRLPVASHLYQYWVSSFVAFTLS